MTVRVMLAKMMFSTEEPMTGLPTAMATRPEAGSSMTLAIITPTIGIIPRRMATT